MREKGNKINRLLCFIKANINTTYKVTTEGHNLSIFLFIYLSTRVVPVNCGCLFL